MRNRSPGPSDWLAALLLLGAMAVGASPRAAEPVAGVTVRDLYYGEALFHFYAQDDFTALIHLLAARDAGRVSHHGADSELLLGGLYLSYGQHDRAERIFARLLDANRSPAVRDRAWFYLGKLRYQRGLYGEALADFARVGDKLPPALAAELPMLVAQSYMAQGAFDDAQQVLAAWNAPDNWLAYARYNLGVALVRVGRLAEGAALLDRIGSMDAADNEQKSLRDKANLALGYAWLQANDADRARPVLERVRLRGPFASKALLGAGWAAAIAADYRGALVPWLELVERDLMDSAVQESFLAVPYALAHLEAHGEAVARYEGALATFDEEMARLDAAIARARQGGLVPALLEGDEPDLGRWYWRLDRVPNNADTRYLYYLLADHSFQEGLKNYRDLAALSRNLNDWRQRLDAFADMVDARRRAFTERLPEAERRAALADLRGLRARRDALSERLARAQSAHDVAALATAEEQLRWQRLAAIAAQPGFDAPASADVRERHRLLRGVVAWDMERDFKERLWRGQRTLRDIDAALAVAETRLTTIRAAQAGQPQRFNDFAVRIAALTPRIATIQAAVDTSLQRQQDDLVAMAVRELDAQRQRLASYRVQARFALAATYDRAGSAQSASAAGSAP